MKKIVVIGTGRMGEAFATAFAKRTSHAVSIRGSHAGSSSAAALSRQLGVRVADDKDLLAADVVFVATPPAAPDEVAAALKCYVGIIVSPMVPGAGGYELKRDCRSSPGYAAIDQHLPSYRASWNKRTGQPVYVSVKSESSPRARLKRTWPSGADGYGSA